MSEEGQLYELTKELVEQLTGRYTENIQDPDYQIAWTYLNKALNIRNVSESFTDNEIEEMASFLTQFWYRSMSNGLIDIDTDERERIKKLLKIKH